MSNGPIAAALAVKRLDEAKSRLAASRQPNGGELHGGELQGGEPRGGELHRALVLAMLADTVTAVRAAGVERVVVVSPDADVLAAAGSMGALGLAEPGSTAPPVDRLNLAFTHAAVQVRHRWPDTARVLFVQADLPAATPAALREVLLDAHAHPQAMVTDRDGSGTTILIRDASVVEHPSFGPGSAAAHRSSGVVELDPERRRWLDLRTDVDTAADLEDARRLGLGPRTAAEVAAAVTPVTRAGDGTGAHAGRRCGPNASSRR